MVELSGQDAINATKNEEVKLIKKDATDAGMGGNIELSDHEQKDNDPTKSSEERTVDSVAYCDPAGNRDAKDTTNIGSKIAVSQRSDEPAGAQTLARCGGWEAACELLRRTVTELYVVQARQIESQRGDDDDASRVCGPQGRRQKAEQARRREDGQLGQEGYILEIALKKYDPGGSSSGKLSVLQTDKGRGWFQVRGARLKSDSGPHWKPYDPGGTHARTNGS